jgi:hypothetical protein
MKKYLLIASVFIAFTACKKEEKGDNTLVETLVNARLTGTMTVEQVKAIMTNYASFKPFVQTGINLYKVEYTTLCNDSKPEVSGLFIIPTNVSAQTPVVVYNHGTSVKNAEPSLSNVSEFSMDIGLCYICASIFNCVILIPDYIGYGTSSHIVHPYIHAETLGQTSFDIIKAYIDYTKITPGATDANRNIVILGYSEGGYTSVALHKKIQESASDIKVVKTYAGAGPYDVENFVKEILRINRDLASHVISSYMWVLATYKEYSGYTKPYDEIYSEEDNLILKNRNYDFGYLVRHPVNLNPANLFRDDYIEMVLNDRDADLKNILKENTLTDFVPSDSLILFHSEADSWVSVNNTINAFNRMKSKGAPVRCEIVPVGANKDHSDAAVIFFQSSLFNAFATQVFAPVN